MKKFIILFAVLGLFAPSVFADDISTAEEESAYLQNRQTVILKQGKIKTIIHGTKTTTQVQDNTITFPTRADGNVIQDNSGRSDILKTDGTSSRTFLHGIEDNRILARAAGVVLDPYAVKIDGQMYYLVKNKKDGNYSIKDILGYDDTKSELFNDLKDLNSDKDTLKLTKDELKKADVRFVAVIDKKLALDDRTKDYDLNNISYIDLNTLRGTINSGKIGSFGYFDVYIIKNGKEQKVTGFVTFDSDEVLWELIRK